MNKRFLLAGAIFLLSAVNLMAQSSFKKVYKKINNLELNIECFVPQTTMPEQGYPTIVFFHGGGWFGGPTEQFIKHCKVLQQKGMVAINVEYRTRDNAGTTPREALIDAKSAIRYVKAHARELKVNIAQMAASGGSAGGHLAAAACYVKGFDDPSDDLSIDPRPTALVLFNPVIDNSANGYGYERVKDYAEQFSPMHNLHHPVPTIFFLGTKDKLVPVSTARDYKKRCEALGGRCDLVLFDGCEHGFFNEIKYKETLDGTVKFLQSIGYIK